MATTDQRNRVCVENDGSRVDARAKVTGAAKYTYDINLPNMVWAQHIRCPYADSTLKSANLDAAKAVPGVLDVEIYSEGRGEYGGQSVGHVCAETPQIITDALRALDLQWEHGVPKTNLRREAAPDPLPAMKPDDQTKVDAVFGAAKFTAEGWFETQVQHHVTLESHCAVVDLKDGQAKVWGSTQGTGSFRDGLTQDLGLDKAAIEVNCEYVGGGFGSKFGPGIEGKLAALMAKKFNRPCKVVTIRKDECRDTGMRPGSLQYYKMAAGEDGKILGGRLEGWSSVGTRRGGGGLKQVTMNLGDFAAQHREVNLTSCPPRPQRAPGWPQAGFAFESILDDLANACGLDPIEFRKKNDPKATRHHQYDVAAEIIGWNQRKPDGSSPGVVKRGFGCGAAEWDMKMFAPSGAEVKIYQNGKVEIRSGTQDMGTGNRTMLVDLLAGGMGLNRKFIEGFNGSTAFPPGPAAGGSVGAKSLAPAIMHAAELAKNGILALAAAELKTTPETLVIKGDVIANAADGAPKMSWADACKLIVQEPMMVLGNSSEQRFRGEGESDGVCLAEVEVDTETGVVRVIKVVNVQMCGLPVNRKVVESQIVGGTIQGISYTLHENRIISAVNGAHCNPNMEWYKIAGPADMPEIIPVIDAPAGLNTGVRSLGEPPIIGVPGAIANAVANAIGARVRSLPITPDKVLAALAEKKGAAA